MHLSYAQIPRRSVNLMDLKEVFRFVSPQVRDAAVKTADQLNNSGFATHWQEGWRSALTDTFGRQPLLIFW